METEGRSKTRNYVSTYGLIVIHNQD